MLIGIQAACGNWNVLPIQMGSIDWNIPGQSLQHGNLFRDRCAQFIVGSPAPRHAARYRSTTAKPSVKGRIALCQLTAGTIENLDNGTMVGVQAHENVFKAIAVAIYSIDVH